MEYALKGARFGMTGRQTLDSPASRKKLQNQHHDGNNQQEMHETASHSESEPQSPHHQQNHHDCPQHKSPHFLKKNCQTKKPTLRIPWNGFHCVGLQMNAPSSIRRIALSLVIRIICHSDCVNSRTFHHDDLWTQQIVCHGGWTIRSSSNHVEFNLLRVPSHYRT
jgi:hypothetical protein